MGVGSVNYISNFVPQNDWMKRFAICKEFIELLDSEQLQLFATKIIFSESSFEVQHGSLVPRLNFPSMGASLETFRHSHIQTRTHTNGG